MFIFCGVEAKRARAHTIRVDHSERCCYCCWWNYCLPESEYGYYDGRVEEVQIRFCKEIDGLFDSLMVDLSLMERLKSRKKKIVDPRDISADHLPEIFVLQWMVIE